MTIWPKLAKRWHLPPNASKLPHPRCLVLTRLDRLGDVVITTACLAEIRRQLPDTRIIFAVREPFAFMLRGNPDIDACLTVAEDANPETLAGELRALEADAIVHLNPSMEIETAADKANIPVRIGYSRKRGERLTAWLPYRWKKTGCQHEALFNFDLLEPYQITAPRLLEPRVTVNASVVEQARQQLQERPAALFHLASFGNKPRVPAPFFAEIARRLHERKGMKLVIVGVSEDDPGITPFLDRLGPIASSVLNLAGKTSVEELAGLSCAASLMVSRDSGPAHLAAAVGCPTLTFFINSTALMSPQRWNPLGKAVRIYTKPAFPLPYEPPHRLARRIVRRFDAEEAYQEAVHIMASPRNVTRL